jgi:hypothetical protein
MSSLQGLTETGLVGASRAADESARTYGEQLRGNGRPERLLRLGVITVEFALIVAAFRVANIETRAFEQIATLALAGFLVHHFLPLAWRQTFFAILSVGSVLLVLGWQQGAWLLGIGGLLIAICHIPVALWLRIALISLVALVLAAERKEILPWGSTIPITIWPILGSMFMFRLIIYLYDLRHSAAPFGVTRALSYFFMLPNVCFPLFPVIDYKTLQRSAYNDDPLRLYQTGIKWMLRGLVQLTLYKLVYLVGVIEPSEAVNGLGAARYMIATYLLYLKISGLFHIIIGLLHMYGYGLAETHHLYLLSSSFTDFWRRINIYWKDFIQKLVFNPAYFALRKLGDTRAMALATLVAFAATWFLHSYQRFWIRGEFPVIWSDFVFWMGLGIVVLVNVLLETRKGRQRSLVKQDTTLRKSALLTLKTAGTFAVICILWTVWSTPRPEDLQQIWYALLNSGPADLATILGLPLGIGLLGALFQYRKREVFGAGTGGGTEFKAFLLQAAFVAVSLSVFISVTLWPTLLRPLSPTLPKLVQDMRAGPRLNVADSEKLIRGYYEDLGDVTRFNDELWAMYGMRPQGWTESVRSQTRERNDGIEKEYIPSTSQVSAGAVRTINSLGLRDREYQPAPGPNTFRVGLIGASHDMGEGVNDDETYENLVEDRLNRELGPRVGKKFEILNFSVHGYRPTQKLSAIEQRMFPLHPQVILYVASTAELSWTFLSVRHLVKNQLLDQFPFIKDAMVRANIRPEALPEDEVLKAKLEPFAEDTFRAILERFRDGALSRGIRPALAILEIPNDNRLSRLGDDTFDRLVNIGRLAKLPILDLRGSFADVWDRKSLWVAPWDDHTNPQGHRLLANRLYSLLLNEGLVPTEVPSMTRDEQGRK